MKLAELLEGTGVDYPEKWENTEIRHIAYDSRKVGEGDIFVCIRGFQTDGHLYAKDAAKQGASVILAEEPIDVEGAKVLFHNDNRRVLSQISENYFGRPSENIRVFAVTGTNGKTSITYLLKGIFEAAGEKNGVLGTIAYVFGEQKYESTNTTPESLELQHLFSKMAKADIEVCAMEVSSHSLALQRTANIRFNFGVFTNLTPDHMDFHKDFNEYYDAKKTLFDQVEKVSAINVDDSYGEKLYNELFADGRRVVSYSLNDKRADYFGEVLDASVRGTNVKVYNNDMEIGEVHIETPGTFSVYNALGAVSIAAEAGYSWDVIKRGIESVKGVPGRFQLVRNSKNMAVVVDYAHTPDALEKVLQTAKEFTEGRLITVFGCGGDRDNTKRPMMGNVAGRLSDFCIITDDNPRTEDPEKIVADILPGIEETECKFIVIENRRRAIKKAISMYEPGDVVVIAGKGHENYQIIGTVKQYFDDCETAQQIIEQEI